MKLIIIKLIFINEFHLLQNKTLKRQRYRHHRFLAQIQTGSIFGENTAQRLRRSVFTPGGRVVSEFSGARQSPSGWSTHTGLVGCYLRTDGYGCWNPLEIKRLINNE